MFVLALSLLALVLSTQLPNPATAQPFTPQVPALTSCPTSTQLLFTIGSANYADYTDQAGTAYYPSYGGLYLTAFNNTDFGATITQLQLALGDNSGLAASVRLRMGVYLLGGGGGGSAQTGMLLGQTDEITLFPGPSQTLAANLLVPVTMLSENQYALGLWADGSFYPGWGAGSSYDYYSYYSYDSYGSSAGAGLYGGTESFFYSDIAMPTSIPFIYSGYQPLGMAAVGCFNPALYNGVNTKSYDFCIATAQYTPAISKTDPSVIPTTSTVSITGLLTVSTASPATTATGTGYTVVSLTGTMTTSTSGKGAYYPQSTTASTGIRLASTTATSTVRSVTASQLLYLTSAGAASTVDANGLAFVTDSGVSVIVQYNSSSKSYQFVASSTTHFPALAGGGQVVSSLFPLLPATFGGTEDPLPAVCNSPLSALPAYAPDAAVSCPAGTSPVSYGDSQLSDSLFESEGTQWSSLQANFIVFRPFVVNQPAVTLYTLQYPMMKNPEAIIHRRLGLFANNGTSLAPQYTLLAQSNELSLYSPGDVMVSANLPTPVTVAAGQYYIGVWFDVPVYAGLWEYAYGKVFDVRLAFASVSAAGAFPATLTSPSADYRSVPMGVLGCAADGGAAYKQWYMCARFSYAHPPSTPGLPPIVTTYNATAILTSSARLQTVSFGSYYPLISADQAQFSFFGTQGMRLDVGSLTFPAPNRLYDPSTTKGGVVVDSAGIQFISSELYYGGRYNYLRGALFNSISKPGSPAPTAQFTWTEVYYSSYITPASGAALFYSNISYIAYTPNMQLPPCIAPRVGPANLVIPQVVPQTCSIGIGSLAVSMGDSNPLDYSFSSLPAGTIYTASITAPADGIVVSQASVTLSDSTTMPPTAFTIGLYSASGALLTQSTSVVIVQVLAGTIHATLTPSVTLTAGSKYTIAIQANNTLNMPTSTTTSPIMTASYNPSGMLPTTFTASGTGGAVPLVLLGCATATHSFCGIFEYWQPGVATTSYIYQGLLATNGVSGADATYGAYQQVSLGSGHLTVLYRDQSTASQSVSGYSNLALNGTAHVYTAASTGPLDASGLSLVLLADNSVRQLAYSSSDSGVRDMSSVATAAGTLISAYFNVSSLASTGGTIPACNIVREPSSVTAPPALPVCAADQSAFASGDDVNDDFFYTNYNSPNFIITFAITTGSEWVSVTQLGTGVTYNPNAVGHVKLAIYNSTAGFIAATNELTVVNPVDETLVGSLSQPVLLAPDTTYLIALWTDVALWQSFTWSNGDGSYENQVCGPATYGAWPAVLASSYYSCAAIPLEAFGCTVAAPAGSGGSGQSAAGQADHSLSNGAVAGIVVGCVVGTNLLLLLCLALCFGSAAMRNGKYAAHSDKGESEVSKMGLPEGSDSDSQRVEMANMEQMGEVSTEDSEGD